MIFFQERGVLSDTLVKWCEWLFIKKAQGKHISFQYLVKSDVLKDLFG